MSSKCGSNKENLKLPLDIVSGGNDKDCIDSSWLGSLLGKDEDATKVEKDPKYDEYQELAHPPVIGKHTDLSQHYETEMRNRFMNQLYLKYPNLLPEEVPKDRFYEYNVTLKYLGWPTGVTTYRVDYGELKDKDTPELYTAAGLHKRPPPLKPHRMPNTPYLNKERNPISAIKEPSKKEPPGYTVDDLTPSRPEEVKPAQTEYDYNYNDLADFFYKKKIYTEPFVLVNTRETLPKVKK